MNFDEWLRQHPEGSRRQAWEAGFTEGRTFTGSASPAGVVRGAIKVFGRVRVTQGMVGKTIEGEITGDPRR